MALLDRPPALVSLHRLSPALYGLPDDPALALRRAGIEAVHELGHTLGLVHCPDYACAMRASHAAEEIDLKGPDFCAACAAFAEERVRQKGLGRAPQVARPPAK
jgi:archaemetzincin